MNFFREKKTISLRHAEPLSRVISENKFRSRSLVFHPIQVLKQNNEITDVTSKAVPIVVTEVSENLQGSGHMDQTVLHAFKNPVGTFLADDSIKVGHFGLDPPPPPQEEGSSSSGVKDMIPQTLTSKNSSAKKFKPNDVLMGKGSKKTGKGKKTTKHEFRVI